MKRNSCVVDRIVLQDRSPTCNFNYGARGANLSCVRTRLFDPYSICQTSEPALEVIEILNFGSVDFSWDGQRACQIKNRRLTLAIDCNEVVFPGYIIQKLG
jgi:hypothetical protein